MAHKNGKEQVEYQRATKQLPVRILTAGLGHALAFLNAKGGKANDALLQDIADWTINKRKNPQGTAPLPAQNDLIKKIMQENSTFLRVTTDEVLAYLQWLTRFAEAELKDKDS